MLALISRCRLLISRQPTAFAKSVGDLRQVGAGDGSLTGEARGFRQPARREYPADSLLFAAKQLSGFACAQVILH